MTFDPTKLIWLDFETRQGAHNLRYGTYRYAETCLPIILSFAIGDEGWDAVENIDGLAYGDLPDDLRQAIEDPETKVVCWNCNFDRAVWNYALLDSPFLAPAKTLDAMAQAMVSNLPASLDRASTVLGGETKSKDGKDLIKLFSVPHGPRPEERPEEWQRFVDYAGQDIIAMRDVFRSTRPLTLEEWEVYWANEEINDRGVAIDVPFCKAAARLAEEAVWDSNRRLTQLTGGAIKTIHQNIALAEWVYDRLPDDESRLIMTVALIEPEDLEEDDEGYELLAEKTIARGVVERLLDYLRKRGCQDAVLMEVLALREFGASAAPKKFVSALNQEIGGRLRGQIVFSGAAQTGRFSGKGTQPQNLTRTVLGKDAGDDYGFWEAPTVDLITDGCTLERLAAFGNGEVPSRKLALVVRPAFVAPPGKTLIKCDYSQVEARVLPWLSLSEGGEQLLDSFRLADRDPTAPDLYKVTAAGMLHKRPEDISKDERQTGKVAVLACGFQGGKGALMSMAANYRLYFSPEEAQAIVSQWRAANAWAPLFWGKHNRNESYGLWGAAMRAYRQAGQIHSAGRVHFMYEANYLGGSLFMILPSGRVLTYPWCRWREHEKRDRRTKQVLEVRETLTFRRPLGFKALWPGLLAENATQATAADLLREALVELRGRLDVVLHAHDEIVVECLESPGAVRAAIEELEDAMTFDREWADGLPLGVETTVRFYYSAAKLKEAA
jgi:DNA polymerase